MIHIYKYPEHDINLTSCLQKTRRVRVYSARQLKKERMEDVKTFTASESEIIRSI